MTKQYSIATSGDKKVFYRVYLVLNVEVVCTMYNVPHRFPLIFMCFRLYISKYTLSINLYSVLGLLIAAVGLSCKSIYLDISRSKP